MDAAAREMGGDPRMKSIPPQKQMDLVEFVAGNMLFVALHEMGHAHVSEMGLPVLGREEDAADAFAALNMLKMGSDFSYRVLVQASRGWFLADKRDRKQGNMLAFYDEHGLDKQRAFHVVCLMVGSDPEKFRELANSVQMPDSRQATCGGDYSNASYSWEAVLKPHRRTADQPKSKIDIVYGPGKGKLSINARSFQAIGFLETLAHYAEEYVWRAPITLEMQSCDEPNAHWDLATRKTTICYELAEEFLQLYQGFTEDRKPSGKMPMNALIARNLKMLRFKQGMSQADVAADSGLPMKWVKRMELAQENCTVTQLEALARALKVETVAFLASPTENDRSGKAQPAGKRAKR
jgi:hypothetical protein